MKEIGFGSLKRLEEIINHLPNVSALTGLEWLHRKRDWAEEFIGDRLPWYEQLENDITVLKGHLNIQKLASCYRDGLRNQSQIQKTIFEIHGAALLTSAATQIDLHVPRGDGSGRNFDIWARVGGYPVNGEFKTRKDQFPFNVPPEPDLTSKIPVYGGSRATMDPHDAEDLGIYSKPIDGFNHIATPESTVIRQIFFDGLGQLPTTGYNFILFGHIEGDRRNLEEALYGTEFIEQQMNKEVIFLWKRAPTGAFCPGAAGEPFKALSGVIWVRLMFPQTEDNTLGRAYKLYLNPCSTPLPNEVTESLNAVMDQWTTVGEEAPKEASGGDGE